VIGEKKEKVEGDEGDDVWEVKYFQVKDRNLDLAKPGDCIHCLTLGRVLRERSEEKLAEFKSLKRRKLDQGLEVKKWWVDKKVLKQTKSPEDKPD
jgi:hypothetical protein